MFPSVMVFVAGIYQCMIYATLAIATVVHEKLQRSKVIHDGAIAAEQARRSSLGLFALAAKVCLDAFVKKSIEVAAKVRLDAFTKVKKAIEDEIKDMDYFLVEERMSTATKNGSNTGKDCISPAQITKATFRLRSSSWLSSLMCCTQLTPERSIGRKVTRLLATSRSMMNGAEANYNRIGGEVGWGRHEFWEPPQ